jgi:hypothetical protein
MWTVARDAGRETSIYRIEVLRKAGEVRSENVRRFRIKRRQLSSRSRSRSSQAWYW